MKRFAIVIRLEDGTRELAGVPEVNVAEVEQDLDRRARRIADRA